MPGMGTGLHTNNPVVVSAFHRELIHQGLVVLVILGLVWVAWRISRARQLRLAHSANGGPADPAAVPADPEPTARRLLRVSFGITWIFDGVLQGQSSMPLGMAPEVIKPAAAASPVWVQHLDNAAATIWSYHPIAAPAAAVWIQIGIGLWLLVAPRGTWSRLAGLASVGWGLVVWVFGEAFGGIFAPGLTWLFGAPGAVLLYCAAGALIGLPERSWATERLGQILARIMGSFFIGMAVLQAWPGRGFWQGQPSPQATAGTLTSMLQQMAQTPQPHLLASWVSAFAGFDAAHGWGVNFFVVVALAAIGAAFLSAQPRLVLAGLVAGVALCLADWVLVEDLGFMGGVGTDPNSMIPMALLLVASYLAITRHAITSETTAPIEGSPRRHWRERLRASPSYAFRSVAALGAVGIILVGAAPMAMAATDPHADPILAQAADGAPQATNFPAPTFDLVDQYGRAVTPGSLARKVVIVTGLDDVCVTQCPLIAQYLKAADGLLGADRRRVEFVAIDENPRYIAPEYLEAFDQNEGLEQMSNWLYLTGRSLSQLQQAWRAFGFAVQLLPGGSMDLHSEIAYVIDPSWRVRFVMNTDPGPGTEATQSSFSVAMADTIRKVLALP